MCKINCILWGCYVGNTQWMVENTNPPCLMVEIKTILCISDGWGEGYAILASFNPHLLINNDLPI